MTFEEQLIEKLRDLPPEKKRGALDFADFLKARTSAKKPRRSLLGLWGDLGFHVTEKEIAEARGEMWGNFPRDIKL